MFAGHSQAGELRRCVNRRATLASLFALAGVGGCSRAPKLVFRVRLTFHVKHPARPKSFSGVWEIWLTEVGAFPNPGTSSIQTLIGEAIPMPFDSERIAFALLVDFGGASRVDGAELASLAQNVGLVSWSGSSALSYAYPDNDFWAKSGGMSADDLRAATPSVPARLPPRFIPAFATFDDPANPKTGRFLDPTDLSSVAGQGAALDYAEIQLVNDPPTRGASLFLPWVGTPSTEPDEPNWTNFRQHPEYFVRKAPEW